MRFFGPFVAVGGLVINDKGQLLMVRRAKDPGKGKLGLPGGFIDAGEAVEISIGTGNSRRNIAGTWSRASI